MENMWIVVCTDQGEYLLATRTVFPTKELAQEYAQTINESRKPLVVAGRFHQLRFSAETERQRACVAKGGHYRDNQNLCHGCGINLDYT